MMAAFNNAFDFKGRANRHEYWTFTVFALVLQILAGVVAGFMHAIGAHVPTTDVIAVLGGGLSLFLFIPSLSVTCRRLHDSDRTAWWVLLAVPLMLVNAYRILAGLQPGQWLPFQGFAALCALALLVFMVLRGTPGRNRFDATDGSQAPRLDYPVILDGQPASRRAAIAFSADAAAILWPSRGEDAE